MTKFPIPFLAIMALSACNPPGTQNEVGDLDKGPAATTPATNPSATQNVGDPGRGPAALGDMTVAAGQIVESRGPGGAKLISGEFEIRPARANEGRVENATMGGACLLAQVAATTDGRCTRDDQCDVRVGEGVSETKWHGYCLGENNDVSVKRCWFKPSDKYCVKGVGAGAHSVPAVSPAEVYTKFDAARGQRQVQWMVYGCLNGPITAGAKPPCAGGPGTLMHDAGTPKAVRP